MATVIPTGTQQKFFAKLESTYDTVAAFVSADAVPLVSLEIQPRQEFIASRERVGTASLQREIKGMAGGTWSASFYVKTEGTTSTAQPDVGAILEAAFGATYASGSDRRYATKATASGAEVTEAKSLQIARHAGKGLYEIINGAWVEQFDVELVANGESMINVSGGFATYAHCFGGIPAVGGSHSTSATSITINARNTDHIRANSYIQFDDAGTVRDNSSAGYLVSAVDKTANSITISPGLEAGIADSTIINPFTPSQTLTTNDPIFGSALWVYITGFNEGFSGLIITGGKVSFATGIHGLDAQGYQGKAFALSVGNRSVTGELQVYFKSSSALTDDWAALMGAAFDGDTYPLKIGAGDGTALKTCTLDFEKVRFHVSQVNIPETDEATATIGFTAHQGTYPGDEFHMNFG